MNSEAVATKVAEAPRVAITMPRDGSRNTLGAWPPDFDRKIRRLWFKDTARTPIVFSPARNGTRSGVPFAGGMPNRETAGQDQYTGCFRNLSNASTMRGRIFAARAAMKPMTRPVA